MFISARSTLIGLWAALASLVSSVPQAVAQAAPSVNSQDTRLTTAFSAMSANLSDPAASFRYAELAIHLGSVQEAVSALERILLQNPSLDNIRLELGILYTNLGNPALGETLIQAALANPSIPLLVRERAEQILRDARRAASPHRFTGTLFAGYRYDSNINSAPGAPTTLLIGLPGQAVTNGKAQGGGSFATYATGRYSYDFGQQNLNRLEINGFANGQYFFAQKNNDYNIGVVGGDIGPWIALPFGRPGSTEFRPYVTGFNFAYGSQQYLSSGGGGVTVQHAIGSDWIATLNFQAAQQQFWNGSIRPTAADQTGAEYRAVGGLKYRISASQFISLDLGAARKRAEFSYYAYNQFSIGGAYTIEYPDPTGLLKKPWSTGLATVFRNYVYDAPFTQVSLYQRRHDQRFEVGLMQLIGLVGTTSLLLRTDYVDNISNIGAYTYRNYSGMAGLQVTF